MKNQLFTLLFCCLFMTPGFSQLVINEISDDQNVIEFKNTSNGLIDISDYHVLIAGDLVRLGNTSIICPYNNRMLAAGEVAVGRFSTFWGISNETGELALFNSDQSTDPSALIDYVQWGSGGQVSESLAVTAGIWTAGDFVPSFFATGSLEYDGDGDSSSDYINQAVNSFCDENGTGCDIFGANIDIPDPTLCVCDGREDRMTVNFSGNVGQNVAALIITPSGIIAGIAVDFGNFMDDVCAPTGSNITLLSYDGEITGLEVGQPVSELHGCFAFSDSVALDVQNLDTTQVFVNDNGQQLMEIDICLVDDITDEPQLINTASSTLQRPYTYAITNENLRLIDTTTANTYDFNSYMPGRYYIYGIESTGEITFSSFTDIDSEFLVNEGCFQVSANRITVNVIEDGPTCFTSTNELEEWNAIQLSPNPAQDLVRITIPASQHLQAYQLYTNTGQPLEQQIKPTQQEPSIALGHLPAGVYFIRLWVGDNQAVRRFVKL